MIVDKRPLPIDPTPPDAPPSYSSLAYQGNQPEKSGFNDDKTTLETSLPSPPVSPQPVKTPVSIEFVKKDKGKSRNTSNNWFGFTAVSTSRTSHEIRNTVQALLRDIVQDRGSNSSSAASIVSSCADTCETHGVSFSDILQQCYIEGHTPLYWAIVTRLPDDHPEIEGNQGPDLLTALISYASPFKDQTITEIRQACVATSDQNLFKRLRQSPGFARMSTVDQMLLGVQTPTDEIEVEEDKDVFAANFVIPQFHKRMAISKQIPLEFIARGRLWRFSFFVTQESNSYSSPAGSWSVTLSLQECSPPTHVDSRLLIFEAASSPSTAVSQPSDTPGSAISPGPPSSRLDSTKRCKSNVIIVRLKTGAQQLEAFGNNSRGYRIISPLDNVAAKLQYPNNPYTDSDEKLRARFEVKLGRPDKECVIC